MKRKISLLVFLLGMVLTAFAQKQYVNIVAQISEEKIWVHLSGNIPSNVENSYILTDGNVGDGVGSIINKLANNGYIVEQMTGDSYGSRNNYYQYILMSKSASPEQGAIETISVDDSEAVEVARYNLQGIPVNENEKGVQIIVYSNYTTKTVVVQ